MSSHARQFEQMASQRRYHPGIKMAAVALKSGPLPQAKQTSKRKRRSKALPVLGAAVLSLSLAGTASAVPGGPAVNLPTSGNGDGNQVFLGEEEISDVSLATFYVFDKEGGDGTSSMVELVGRGGGCEAAVMVVGGATL